MDPQSVKPESPPPAGSPRVATRALRRRLVVKVVATLAIVCGAVGFLIVSSVDAGVSYYLHVDEVTRDPGKWVGKPLQLHGYVKPGTIVTRPDGTTIDRTFVEQWQGATLEVHFRGVVPDTFKDNAEVVAKGRLRPGGVFEADDLTAKCPSKYQGAGAT